MLQGTSVLTRRGADPRPAPDDRRDAGAAARRVGDLVRPQRLAPDPARLPGRAHPRADRRHRLDRRVEHHRRSRGHHRSAARRADRGAARPVGAAVRLVGGRRRRQRHRQAHPAHACPTNGYRVERDRHLRLGRRTSARAAPPATSRSASNLVLHADGSYLKTDDLRIGGYVLSRQRARRGAVARSACRRTADEPIDFAASAALRGRLPNTAAETWTAGVGASIITDTGISASRTAITTASTACRSATRPRSARSRRRRASTSCRTASTCAARCRPAAASSTRIRVRAGHANYRHFELEEDGAIGTAFYNKGTEGRLELVQANRGGWQGASGVQYFNRAVRRRRRRGVPAAQRDQPDRPLHAPAISTSARSRPRAGCATRSPIVAARTPRRRPALLPRQRAVSTRCRARSAPPTASTDGVRIGLNLLAHRARAVGRGAVRQRRACRHAGVRARQPRFPAGEVLGRRGDAARAWRRLQPRRVGLLQLVHQLHLREPGRPGGLRGRRRAVGPRRSTCPASSISRPTRAITGSRRTPRCGSRTIGGYTINADVLGDYVHATIVDLRPGPAHPAGARARRAGGAGRPAQRRASRSSTCSTRTASPRSRRRPTATRWSTPRVGLTPFGTRQQDHAAAERQQHLRRRTPGATPAS